jgi:hypothetical protein
VVPASVLEAQAAAEAELERLAAEVAALENETATLRGRLNEAESQRARAEQAAAGDADTRRRLAEQVASLSSELEAASRRSAAAQTRLAAAPKPPPTLAPPAGLDFGRYHALVIGNSSYASLPALPGASETARRVGELLEKRYGFRVRLLVDASRAAILEALNALRKDLRAEDNLLVFYAGRSATEPASDRGWWQPIDADPQSRVAWIPTQVLADHLELMPSRRAMVIADGHFPGTLTRSSIARVPASASEKERRDLYRSLLGKRSRLVLAPGAQSSAGGSARFDEALVAELEKGSGILEASTLYQRVNARLTLQTPGEAPEFAPLRWAAHEGGADFFFVGK